MSNYPPGFDYDQHERLFGDPCPDCTDECTCEPDDTIQEPEREVWYV